MCDMMCVTLTLTQERVEEEEEGDMMEGEGDLDEEEDLGPSVEELIERAQMEQQRLVEVNEMLQKKVSLTSLTLQEI